MIIYKYMIFIYMVKYLFCVEQAHVSESLFWVGSSLNLLIVWFCKLILSGLKPVQSLD